jgi:hypothetical protein
MRQQPTNTHNVAFLPHMARTVGKVPDRNAGYHTYALYFVMLIRCAFLHFLLIDKLSRYHLSFQIYDLFILLLREIAFV